MTALGQVGKSQGQAPPDERWFAAQLTGYGERLDRLVAQSMGPRLAAHASLSEAPALRAALEDFRDAAQATLRRFESDYRALFGARTAGALLKRGFSDAEAGLIKSIDRGLESLFNCARVLDSGHGSHRLRGLRATLERATRDLRNYPANVANGLARDLDLVAPTFAKKARLIAGYGFHACVRGAPVFEVLRRFPERAFMKPGDTASAIEFRGWDPKRAKPGAVYIMLLNHDYGIFDTVVAERAACAMNSPHPFMLATARNCPHYKLGHPREDNIVFSDDPKPIETLQQRIMARPVDETCTVMIAPEGQVPFNFARFPLTTKPGAFLLAHKLARALAERREVYLVRAFSNASAYIAGDPDARLTVTVDEPLRVPTTRDGGAWAAAQRTAFEVIATRNRGQRTVDLKNPRFVNRTVWPVATAN